MTLIGFILMLFAVTILSFVIYQEDEMLFRPAIIAIFLAFAAGMLAVQVAIHWQHGEVIYPESEEVE